MVDLVKNPTDVVSGDLIKEARAITTYFCTSASDDKESDLGNVRAYKFLNNISTLLRLLPPPHRRRISSIC